MSDLHLTSWTLIKRAAAGDPADREQFAQRYAPVVRAYFSARWRLPLDHGQVDDAAQEVFLQCFKADGALQNADPSRGTAVRTFLYGVARHVGLVQERRLASRRELTAQSSIRLEAIEHSEITLSRAFDRAWAQLVLAEAGELARRRAEGNPFRLRAQQALELRFEVELPAREVAIRLDVDAAAVHRLLRRAKRDFRAAFLEVMGAYNPEASEDELKQKCVDLMTLL